jgi:predicted ATPase with chaperone activity
MIHMYEELMLSDLKKRVSYIKDKNRDAQMSKEQIERHCDLFRESNAQLNKTINHFKTMLSKMEKDAR